MILDPVPKLDFPDVLIRPKRSTLESRSDMDLYREIKPRWGSKRLRLVPIIAANMATGSFAMARVFRDFGMSVAIHKFHTLEEWQAVFATPADLALLDHVWFTIGMSESELDLYRAFRAHLNRLDPTVVDDIKLCVDIANGYTQKFAGFIGRIRNEFPLILMAAGNVATPEMVQELVINGADLVKVGIGPGSQCTTRLKTGVGYPQISASLECADAAHGLRAGIILDGGMRCPGDIAKAFCANADLVMIGGMFAGTDECEGELVTRHFQTAEVELQDGRWVPRIEERTFKIFYGMSSEYAQQKHMTGMKDYRTSEGRVEEIPARGSVIPVIHDILGGLRSAGTYIGAKEIKHFGMCATLVQVHRQHDRF